MLTLVKKNSLNLALKSLLHGSSEQLTLSYLLLVNYSHGSNNKLYANYSIIKQNVHFISHLKLTNIIFLCLFVCWLHFRLLRMPRARLLSWLIIHTSRHLWRCIVFFTPQICKTVHWNSLLSFLFSFFLCLFMCWLRFRSLRRV